MILLRNEILQSTDAGMIMNPVIMYARKQPKSSFLINTSFAYVLEEIVLFRLWEQLTQNRSFHSHLIR